MNGEAVIHLWCYLPSHKHTRHDNQAEMYVPVWDLITESRSKILLLIPFQPDENEGLSLNESSVCVCDSMCAGLHVL